MSALKFDLYKTGSMSLERALLHASSSSAFSGPKSMEGFEQLSMLDTFPLHVTFTF